MITISNVSKEFRQGLSRKKVKALTNLSLQVPQGEVFGFLGPNGAGKSTTIKTLLNLIYPDTGYIEILGQNVRIHEVRRQVGYLPESPYFYDYLTAEEILSFGGTVSGMSKTDIASQKQMLFDKLNLQHAKKRPLRTYSKGMLQRVGLAFALIHDPQVVILDEPMSGLDPIGRKMVGDLLLELKSEGKTIFFSTHILTDVERFSDRVGIIVGGNLVFVDTMTNITAKNDSLESVFLREVGQAGGGTEQ